MAASNGSDGSHDDPDNRSLTRTHVLSFAEAAELLGIPRSTVHYLVRRGELWARRVGRRWLFPRDGSPPRSRRWTSPAPGARRTMTSGAATAIGYSRSLERLHCETPHPI